MEIIEAALFDLDDTLVDRSAAFTAVAEQLYDSQPSMQKGHSREAAVKHMIHCDSFDDRFDRILQTWPGIDMSASDLRAWYYEALSGALKPDELAPLFTSRPQSRSHTMGHSNKWRRVSAYQA